MRATHTAQIPGEPIPCGYKIIDICDTGYTPNWLYSSRFNGIVELQLHNGRTSTGSAILQLCNILDPGLRHFMYIYGAMHSQQPPCSGCFGCSTSVVSEGVARHVRILLCFFRGSGTTSRACLERRRWGEVLAIRWEGSNIARFLTTVYP